MLNLPMSDYIAQSNPREKTPEEALRIRIRHYDDTLCNPSSTKLLPPEAHGVETQGARALDFVRNS
jgi:hypothetical protein